MCALPIERFKNSYSNWRHDVFSDTSLAVDKTEDNLYIPASSPFEIQLLELPRKDIPSTVTVYCYDTVGYFTEVETAPTQGQFRVDYPPTDGEGTGLIQFNQNDAGKQVKITYKATGSSILEEFLNTKISWPDGSPTDRQIAAYLSSTLKFAWRDNPIRYFHEHDVIYNSSGEFESCLIFRFKKASTEGKVLLELKGAKMFQAFYTELKLHNHDAGTLAGSQPNHTHPSGNESQDHVHTVPQSHVHLGVQPGSGTSGYAEDPIITSGQNQSHNHAIQNGGNDAVAISGTSANTGASRAALYPNALKVYIDSVDKTSQILALAGMAALGDGTSGHAFVTTGTGEMDITSLITSDKFWEIKITQGNTDAGGRCMLHLELN